MSEAWISGPDLDDVLANWHQALGAIHEVDVETAGHMLAQRLLAATDEDEHVREHQRFAAVSREADRVADLLRGLARRVEELRLEWRAERRYTEAGLAELREHLREQAAFDAVDARGAWLIEVLHALELGELTAAVAIATIEIPIPAGAGSSVAELHEGLQRWAAGDSGAGLAVIERLATGELASRLEVDNDRRVQVLAHRIAAWLAMSGTPADAERARRHLDDAFQLDPANGRTLAERAAMQLLLGQVDAATTEAHRAVEAHTRSPVGYLVLGACAEAAGDLTTADRLYGTALGQMTAHDAESARRRISLLKPTGRMLLRLAEHLLSVGRPVAALSVLDDLEHVEIADPRLYPDADVYQLRGRSLEALRRPREAAAAYLEAGRRDYWNDDDAAAQILERSRLLDGSVAEAGWLAAAALMARSFPQGAEAPRYDLVTRALHVWEETLERHGWPEASMSWAYLTRAFIADESTFDSEGERQAALWEAVTFVERSLVHDTYEADRWGTLARYLRAVDLEALALEAADHAAELGVGSYPAMAERMALLANAGRLDEAERVARQIESTFGQIQWVSGVRAWLAFHRDRPREALELLRTPLAGDYDPSWYLSLAALSHVTLGEREPARAAYRQLVERTKPLDSLRRGQLAAAWAVLGDISQARRWATEAVDGSSPPSVDVSAAAGFVAFADHRPGDAEWYLSEAAERSTNERELDEVLTVTRLRLAATEDADDGPLQSSFERVVSDSLGLIVEAERARLQAMPHTANRELASGLGEHGGVDPLGPAGVAVLAVHARREAAAGRPLVAADDYARLESTAFGPEALIGLRRAWSDATSRAAAAGRIDEVRRLEERLREWGWTDAVSAARAAADALMAAGRPNEALDELVRALPTAADGSQVIALHAAAGAAAMRLREPGIADEHFANAQRLAESVDDYGEVAELAVQRCLAAAVGDDLTNANEHARVAVAAWKLAGAFDPSSSLRQELMAAMRDDLGPRVEEIVASLVDLARNEE
jgi:hypothetical protein